MSAAVIYCRISKDDRGDHLGVDRQERACRKLAADRGLDVREVLVDNDVSAYSRKARPAFEQLVDMLKDGAVAAVVCYHADRLYRRATDLERLVDVVEATGAQVHTVAAGDVDLSTASGRMIARMLGAAAQHESERMGERLRMKSDELAAKGRPPGGRPPYGYGKGYAVNPGEAAAVRRMADRVLAGASLLGIARELTADGIPTREGRPWHHSSVRATLVNPAIAGLRVHRREVAGPGDWTPILEREMWEQVRAVLADPARKRKRPTREYLLSGLIETPTGDRMIGRPDRRADGTVTRRTYATRTPATTSMAIDADKLEACIIDVVLAALDDAPLPLPTDSAPGPGVTAIESELAELAKLRGEGTISLAEWLAAREPLQERLTAAQRAAGRKAPTQLAKLLQEPGAARKAWKNLDLGEKRQIIEVAIERIVLGPATRGRWTPVEDRLLPANGGRIHWKV